MTPQVIIGILAAVFALGSLGVMAYFFLVPREDTSVRNLMGKSASVGLRAGAAAARGGREMDQTDFDQIKAQTKKNVAKKKQLTIEEKLFQAGMVDEDDKASFARFRIIAPIVSTPVGMFLGSYGGTTFILIGAIFGLLIGLQMPFSVLDRKILRRHEDILYYLPLVIEQIAIGVSSSLDIGPCIAKVVQMADERDSHNVVTELLRYAQYHVKSGISLDDALTELGVRSGHTELKHAFMSLAQVARHGGEITRQLQELADAVANQRETKIEAKIKKLELEATGPVALVFMGFLLILLIGFGIQIKQAFG
ncbi:MAG: type II secretion system F family protein [Bdellovibrionales bacterium]|nr:type II secretion system F family protein [Bdellovibrionales bacterium]